MNFIADRSVVYANIFYSLGIEVRIISLNLIFLLNVSDRYCFLSYYMNYVACKYMLRTAVEVKEMVYQYGLY